MTNPYRDESQPTPRELREQMEHTRDELGLTVEELAAKADVKTRVQDQAAVVKEQAAVVREQAADLAAQLTEQVRVRAWQVARLVKAGTPDAVSEKADQAAVTARANRTPLIAGAAVLGLYLVIRRGRRTRRR